MKARIRKREEPKGHKRGISKTGIHGSNQHEKLKMNWDEDIESLSSDDDNPRGGKGQEHFDSDDDNNKETANEKRVRLAKEYLKDIQQESVDDLTTGEMGADSFGVVSETLRRDRLSLQKKLMKGYSRCVSELDISSLSISRYGGHDQAVTTVTLSADATFAVSGSKDNSLIRWDTETGAKTYMISRWRRSDECMRMQEAEVLATAITTDGKYCAAGGRNGLIHVFDLRTNSVVKVFEGHRDTVSSLAFKQDSYSLYSGSFDRCIKHWDLNEMGYLETLFGHQESVFSLDLWNKERPVSSSGDRTVRLWNTIADTHLVFKGHLGGVDNVQMLTDETFVSGGQDGTLCLWKETQKRPIASVDNAHGFCLGTTNSRWISSLCAVKMSDLVLSGSNDGFLRFWSVGKPDGRTKLDEVLAIPVPGFINAISVSKQVVALGTGREHKFGRWWCEKGNKNKVFFIKIPLEDHA